MSAIHLSIMKLHLPVFLCRAVHACFSLVAVCSLGSGSFVLADELVTEAGEKLPFVSLVDDSVPGSVRGMSTDISITEEDTEVLVDEVSDIESYRNASASVTFRVTESWTLDAYSDNLMLSNGSSWRFTSDIVENPKSLTFSNTNYY